MLPPLRFSISHSRYSQLTKDAPTRLRVYQNPVVKTYRRAEQLELLLIRRKMCSLVPAGLAEGVQVSVQQGKGTPALPQGEDNFINPFTYNSPLSLPEKIKMALMTFTLLPIRVLGIVSTLALGYAVCKSAIWGISRKDLIEKPLPPARKWIMLTFFRPLTRLFLFFLGYHWIKVTGTPSRESGTVLVANHISFPDPLYIISQNLPSTIAKDEVSKIPIIGTCGLAQQVIWVDRSTRDSRRFTAEQIRARALGNEWPQLLIFPEGTTTNGTCLINFKTGGFIAGNPVQPIILSYSSDRTKPSFMGWVPGGMDAGLILYRMLCNLWNHLEVRYLDVYYPSEEEKRNPQLYANNVRAYMSKEGEIPVTFHTFDDVVLLSQAQKLKIPIHKVNLPAVSVLKNLYDLDITDLSTIIESFKKMDTSGDGLIDLTEFAKGLGLPKRSAAQLFSLFDKDNSGTIDIKEFVLGLSILSPKISRTDTVRFAFRVLDSNFDGDVYLHDLKNVLQSGWGSVEDPEVEALFNKLDANKNGKISEEEFIAFLEKNPEYLSLFGDLHTRFPYHDVIV